MYFFFTLIQIEIPLIILNSDTLFTDSILTFYMFESHYRRMLS